VGERIEAVARIPFAILYSVVLYVLEIIVGLVLIVQFFYTLILGRRHEGMACFANKYSSLNYHINRYLLFATNKRPLFGGPGWEETLPCDFERMKRKQEYEELRNTFDRMV
jgi:hypothetical protein